MQLQEFQACVADKELCPTENTRETNSCVQSVLLSCCFMGRGAASAFKDSEALEYKTHIFYSIPL